MKARAGTDAGAVMAPEDEAARHGGDLHEITMDEVVVEGADGDAVLQARRAVVGPPLDVMDLRPCGTQGAPRPLAVPVAGEDRGSQRSGKGAFRQPHVEGLTGWVEHDPAHEGVAQQDLQRCRGERRAVLQLSEGRLPIETRTTQRFARTTQRHAVP